MSSLPKAVTWKRTSRFTPVTFWIVSERSTVKLYRPVISDKNLVPLISRVSLPEKVKEEGATANRLKQTHLEKRPLNGSSSISG